MSPREFARKGFTSACVMGLALGLAGCASLAHAGSFSWWKRSPGFVKVRGAAGFARDGKPYTFLGANLWYGATLGREGAPGDRERLRRELDRLRRLGVNNLRVLAGTEGPDSEPWRITPALQSAPGVYREELLRGLDFLLREMRSRDMTAVVCLNNFWPWSGGMSQYLNWAGAGPIPYPPPAPGGDWTTYQRYTQGFYSNEAATRAAADFIRAVVTRTNSLTGRKYADDPTILAWELANEPRGVNNVEAFNRWIDQSAHLIKSLDPDHLVTTGVEGETPWPAFSGMDLIRNHSSAAIDYVTAHIWVQNWGWFDPARGEAALGPAIARMKIYLDAHAEKARALGKPLVLEEFGIARDDGSYDPTSSTAIRDRYYAEVFQAVLDGLGGGNGLAGVNFWAWAGEGQPLRPYGGLWKSGNPFTGDPPHEAQGWYGVYAGDASTHRVIADYSRRFSELWR